MLKSILAYRRFKALPADCISRNIDRPVLKLTTIMKLIIQACFFRPIIVLTALAISACDGGIPKITEQVDPWFDPPGAINVEPELVPQSAHHPVAPERIAEAEQFLEEIAISQISPAEVEYFAGQKVDLPDVTRPYLIRGLYRTKQSHSVRIVGSALWVASHDDPTDTAPMRRGPLVLIMDEVPERIYVSIGQ